MHDYRVIYLGPNVEEGSFGLRMRDRANREGRCPVCKAEVNVTKVDEGLFAGTFEHEDWCPVPVDTPADRATHRAVDRMRRKR